MAQAEWKSGCNNARVEEDAKRLAALIAGELESSDEEELTTKLDHKPELRRALADMVLDAEQTGARPAIRIQPGSTIRKRRSFPGVDIGATLGQGGMAVVRIGRQLKVDRAVAVKALRADRQSPEDVKRLLREARITGRLEHPNIVPVHDIVRGEDGVPQVVLKLIEGDTWSSLMQDAERVAELFGEDDLLEWNLGVLMSVARALSFAHSRGVIHRDVKPSNVMVGPFGEVYLLDWGIALELDDPSSDYGATELAGTTGYMAPEQVVGSSAPLGPWTDTYLLGATLFHVLTGRPPHAGTPLEHRVADMLESKAPPELPDDVPAELRRITRSALEHDVDKRTASPEEFRLALADFLEHRGALRLAERGARERERAAEALERNDEAEWERAALSAEVAYRASLEEWPECPAAQAGVNLLAALRVTHALETGEPQVAARLVETHQGLSSDLQQRVAEAVAKSADEEARLRRLVSDVDRGFGHRIRGILGGVFGLIWVVFWSAIAFSPPKDVTLMIAFPLLIALVGVPVVALRGRQLLANRLNRTSMTLVATALAMTAVWCLGASWLGLEMQTIIIGLLLVWALFTWAMGILMDPWGGISAVAFTVAFLIASYEPRWTPYAVLGANLVLIFNQVGISIARARRGFEELPVVGSVRAPGQRR